MIKLNNVTKSINGKLIVEDISFTLKRGEKYVILGPSGSGKTTILRLIAGLESPDTGEIFIDGKKANSLAPYKRNIAMVFQDLALWPHMTAEENIAFCINSKDKKEKVNNVLTSVGLNQHQTKYPHELSGGKQQRLALARSIAINPRILLLDEPLSNVDSLLKEELMVLIIKLWKEFKMTVVYVTHNLDEAFQFSENLIILSQGRIEQIGTREGIYNNPSTDFVKKFLKIGA